GVADLPLGEELGEAVDRLAERHVAPPVQEIEVEAVRRETSQAALARLAHPLARPVLRIELAHQEDLFAAAGNRLADDPFGAAVRKSSAPGLPRSTRWWMKVSPARSPASKATGSPPSSSTRRENHGSN